MDIHTLQDPIEVQSASGRSLAFAITGEPPVQERHRLMWRRTPPTANIGRLRPIFYDPSSAVKARYKAMVAASMVQYGLTPPYFNVDEAVTLEVRFVLARRRRDWRLLPDGTVVLTQHAQAFPRGKDVDNLLKLLMDALQGPIYTNDKTVTKVIVSKLFSENANAMGWTEVQLSTTSVAPPLARGVWA